MNKKPRKNKRTFYQIASLAFFAISIVFILFIAYIAFSKATVVLKPAKTDKKAEAKITISAMQSEIDLEKSIMPGSLAVQEIEKIYSAMPIQNKEFFNKASGKVAIFNNQNRQQYLLVESQLEGAKDKAVFLTDKAIVIPANSKYEMSVTAKDAGSKENIPPQRFNFIKLSPSMQKLVYAESYENMKGGLDKGNVLTQEDIQNSIEINKADLFTSLRTEILKSLENSNKTIRKELSKEEIIEFSPNIPAGSSASQFDLKIKGRITALAFNENNLASLAISDLKSKITENEEFLKCGTDSLNYSNVSLDWDNAKAEARIEMPCEAIARLSPSLFEKERLIGMSKYEAIKYLESYPEIGSAEISFFPPWNNTIPGGLKSNIKVEIQNEF